ncbi:MAG: hypothetical protein V3V84_09215 [Candidatus Bathyarchaeia archaeon]
MKRVELLLACCVGLVVGVFLGYFVAPPRYSRVEHSHLHVIELPAPQPQKGILLNKPPSGMSPGF